MNSKALLVLTLLCTIGCQPVGQKKKWGFDGVEVNLKEYKELLRDRIDTNSSVIVLQVQPLKNKTTDVDLLKQGRYQEFESVMLNRYATLIQANSAFAVLESQIPYPMGVKESTRFMFVGSQKDESIPYVLYDIYNGEYDISSAELPSTVDFNISDEQYISMTNEYLQVLGVDANEIGVAAVVPFNMQKMDITGSNPNVDIITLEKVMYIHRQAGSITVVDDRLIFSYHLDGRIRKLSGKWSPIDYQNSQWVSTYGSVERVVNNAIREMIRNNVNPLHEEEKIILRTSYRTTMEDDITTLNMVLLIYTSASNSLGGFTDVVLEMEM